MYAGIVTMYVHSEVRKGHYMLGVLRGPAARAYQLLEVCFFSLLLYCVSLSCIEPQCGHM